MRTTLSVAGVITLGVAAMLQPTPSHAMIDCNGCEARYQQCLAQRHDESYCMGYVGSACVKQCPLASVQRDLDLIDAKTVSFAMNRPEPGTRHRELHLP